MKVILTGTEGWAIDQVGRDLRGRGHDVLLCNGPDDVVFSCIGLSTERSCPIERGADVIVTIRAHPIPQPTRREVAITCAVLRGVPLVVAGSTVLNPFATIASAVVEGYDDIETTCAGVIGGRSGSRPAACGAPVRIRPAH